MMIPEFLYGTQLQVKPRARAWVKRVSRGALTDHGSMVESGKTEAWLLLDEGVGRGAGAHFRLYAPLSAAVSGGSTDEVRLKVVDALLGSAWGVLGLMGQYLGLVAMDDARVSAFLRKALEYWPIYIEEGARFAPGILSPATLWAIPTSMFHTLARRGISGEELRAPLPNDDLRALLERHADKFMDVLEKPIEATS